MENTSLAFLKANEIGTIKNICGGCSAKKRLYELGLNKGKQIKVLKNDLGPIILDVSGCKLALGRGLADKVMIDK